MGYMENGPGPVRPAKGGSDSSSPWFFPGTCLFDFFLWSENSKGSLKKENAVLGHSFSDYLIGRIGSLGIHPISQSFAPTQQQ
jgi:hypothetical protein